MRLFAIHDKGGNIDGFVSAPDDVEAVNLQISAGLEMTEVNPPDGLTDADLEDGDRVSELVDGYRVETASSKASLKSR